KRQNDKRFECDTPGIEWTIVGSNADYLALLVREYFEPYNKLADFDKLIHDARRNYIEKTLTQKSEINYIGKLFDKAAQKKDPKYLLEAYTAETEFYGVLNRNLAQATLDGTEPIKININQNCAAIVGIIVHHSLLDGLNFHGKSYRGMTIDRSELEKYKKGTRILTKSFLSSSQNPKVATGFAKSSAVSSTIRVLCIYDIRNRRSGLNLEEISKFAKEQEVLIMPYTAFKIMEVTHLDNHANDIKAEIKLKECEPW
ncbi:unnamed protein product, partial [Rotaria socialis]